MNRRTIMTVLDWAVPVGFGLALWLVAPLRTALQFGGDEHYELMKGLLVSLGHPLYSEVWNDQPPLHTELLGLLFRIFGPSAYVGRLLSLGFAMILVGSLYGVVSRRSGRVAGLVSVGLLVSCPHFLQLSVSVMLELPAMAVAMASVWAWFRYLDGGGRRWLVVSGVLFGCALQVKLTAVILGPALMADFIIRQIRRGGGMIGSRIQVPAGATAGPRDTAALRPVKEAAVWCGAAVGTIALVMIAFYRTETLGVFWASHFSEGTAKATESVRLGFRPGWLLETLWLSVPALLGIVMIGARRRWDWLPPVVLLGTVGAVHLWHRPYWYYYVLHFAIPMSWLGGVGIVELLRFLWRQDIWGSMAARVRFGIGWLAWSAVVSLVLTLAPEQVWHEVHRLKMAPRAADDAHVLALKEHAGQTRWVFTDRSIAAFWAGLPVPPELAVMSSKRRWSGQINKEEVLLILERYRPELVVLAREHREWPALWAYVREHYELKTGESAAGIYFRKSLDTSKPTAAPRGSDGDE